MKKDNLKTNKNRNTSEKEVLTLVDLMKHLKHEKSKNGLYATLDYNGRKKKVSVNSREYLNYVTKMYYEMTGQLIEDSSIKNRLKLIECDLEFENAQNQLYSERYIYDNETILIDMGNEQLQYVEVNNEEYRIVEPDQGESCFCTDVLRKPMEIIPLEELDTNILLEGLDSFINLSEDDLFMFKIWAVACMYPPVNAPILYLLGGAGTGKSSMQRIISELLDPSNRGLINWDDTSQKELAIMLDHSYLINFDNVSKITPKKSDMLCQCVTGGKQTYRKLYTDAEEVTYNLQGRVIISSVENCISRADLASRTIYMNVPKLKNKGRIQEDELVKLFEDKKAQILSELLTTLVCVLDEYPKWKKTHISNHRLAGFEVFGSLVAYILDQENGYERFMNIIREKYIQQVFPSELDRIFIKCLFETIEEVFDGCYSGGSRKLYDSVCDWIEDSSECSYNTEVNMSYDRFAKMLHQKKGLFNDLGYNLEFTRIVSDNVSALTFEKITGDNTD